MNNFSYVNRTLHVPLVMKDCIQQVILEYRLYFLTQVDQTLVKTNYYLLCFYTEQLQFLFPFKNLSFLHRTTRLVHTMV